VHNPLFANAHQCPVRLTFGVTGFPKKNVEKYWKTVPLPTKCISHGEWFALASPHWDGAINANEIYLQKKDI
jgi:hypothetical protein